MPAHRSLTPPRPGSSFVCKLPPGYDDRSTMTPFKPHGVIVAHPDLPPLLINTETGDVKELKL